MHYTHQFEEVVQRVVVQFEVQLLHDDQLHPVHIPGGELAAIIQHHGTKNCVQALIQQNMDITESSCNMQLAIWESRLDSLRPTLTCVPFRSIQTNRVGG